VHELISRALHDLEQNKSNCFEAHISFLSIVYLWTSQNYLLPTIVWSLGSTKQNGAESRPRSQLELDGVRDSGSRGGCQEERSQLAWALVPLLHLLILELLLSYPMELISEKLPV
jgi:hypothetical protein